MKPKIFWGIKLLSIIILFSTPIKAWAASNSPFPDLSSGSFIIVISIMLAVALYILYISDSLFRKKLITNIQKDASANKEKIINWQAGNEKMYRILFEQVKSGIFIANENGVLIYANNSLAQILGYKSNLEITGLNLKEELAGSQKTFFDLLGNINDISEHSLKLLTKEGKKITLSLSGNKIWDDDAKVYRILGVVHNITDKSHTEQLLVSEKHKLETLFDFFDAIDQIRDLQQLYDAVVRRISNIMDVKRCSIMIFDKNHEFMAIQAAYGLPLDLISQAKVFPQEDSISARVAENKEPLLVKNIDYDQAFDVYRKPYYQGRSLIVVPLLVGDNCRGVISITDKKSEIMEGRPFEDIDLKIMKLVAHKVAAVIDNIAVYTELNLLTTTDPMTNVYNYRKLLNGLDYEIQRFNREKTNLHIFMIDLDDFKSYNDTFGHPEGDELLRNIGKILTKNLRSIDLVCRYAGDEFCVVMSDVGENDVQVVAQKIVQSIEAFPFKRKVTISIGIAQFEAGLSKKEFIQKADTALYQAKHAGKNQVVIS